MADADPAECRADDTATALDWVVEFATAHGAAGDHYFHLCDGRGATCGCFYQGEGVR